MALMPNVNTEFIEKYQLLLEQDPQSKVFAPLGEAYRKMGMLKEAIEVLQNGVQKHPNFPSGRVALAKVYIESNRVDQAIDQLLQAIEFSSENILAYRLLAECYLKSKQTKNALKAFKMILFLNPQDLFAQEHVQKLESLTADEYEDEVFEMKPLLKESLPIETQKSNDVIKNKIDSFATFTPNPVLRERQLERIVSLIDAFIARGDIQSAISVLTQGENKLGLHPEIAKRKSFIQSRLHDNPNDFVEGISPLEKLNQEASKKKIDLLESLIQRIHDRRVDQNLR